MIIGFGYRAGSGKDTACAHLATNFRATTQLAFADPLKKAAQQIFGFSHAQVFGDLKEVVDPFWGFTPRFALQKMGTEAMKGVFGPGLWVESMRRHMDKAAHLGTKHFVFSDVRFPAEADWILGLGGVLVRLDRNNSGAGTHASETAMDDYPHWDYVWDNNGTLPELRAKLNKLGLYYGLTTDNLELMP